MNEERKVDTGDAVPQRWVVECMGRWNVSLLPRKIGMVSVLCSLVCVTGGGME